MPYQGRNVNTEKTTNLRKVDSIASQFTGAQTVFSLTSSNVALFPGNARNLQIAINGIWQEPDAAYSVAGSVITFTGAPLANSTFHGIVLGEVASLPNMQARIAGMALIF